MEEEPTLPVTEEGIPVSIAEPMPPETTDLLELTAEVRVPILLEAAID